MTVRDGNGLLRTDAADDLSPFAKNNPKHKQKKIGDSPKYTQAMPILGEPQPPTLTFCRVTSGDGRAEDRCLQKLALTIIRLAVDQMLFLALLMV